MRVRTHTNPFNFTEKVSPLNKNQFKNPNAPLDLEIGFGRGIFLRNWAKKYPDRNIIGVEVRKNIVTILEDRLDKEGLINNSCLIHSSGERVLEDCIPNDSIDTLFIFHPDPWFKKKHHKRRFLNSKNLILIMTKLKKGGLLHVSTDVHDLWLGMIDTLNSSKGICKTLTDFWSNDYITHWHEFSIKDSRDSYFGSWKKL